MLDDTVPSTGNRLNYLDFDVEVSPGQGRDYPVAVIRSPAGEGRAIMHFPFDELALDNSLKDLQIAILRSSSHSREMLSPQEEAVHSFGQALFNALFTGEVRSRYDVSQREAAGTGRGLRLRLHIHPPELAVLPWEFMYDPRQAEYTCLSCNTPIIRYLEIAQPTQPLVISPPLRILGMVASPRDLPPLDVEREKQRLQEAIKDLQANGLIELTWQEGQGWPDLMRTMRGGPWHIFHFIGHGGFDPTTGVGLIALADETGQTHNLHAPQLARLLADHRALRLVLLNSCEGARGSECDIFSSTSSILVRRGIPAVLAMQYPISDRAAIEFSRACYEALADGMPVDAAVTEARKAVSLAITNTLEWGTPVLHMRSPDGVLFNIQHQGSRTIKAKASLKVTPQVMRETQPTQAGARRPLWLIAGGLLVALLIIGAFAIGFSLRIVATLAPTAVASAMSSLAVSPIPLPTASPTSLPIVPSSAKPPTLPPTPPIAEQPTVAKPPASDMLAVPAGNLVRGSTMGEIRSVVNQICPLYRDWCSLAAFEDELTWAEVTSPKSNIDYLDSHNKTVNSFSIDRYEVTNAQYSECVKAGVCKLPDTNARNPRRAYYDDGQHANYPVVYVTWSDAHTFCTWVGKRLPTALEWEKAARGTDGRWWPWGNRMPTNEANFRRPDQLQADQNQSVVVGNDLAPVDAHPADVSPCGVLNMAGNVMEWVDEWYHRDDLREIRGGSWNVGSYSARAANRAGVNPNEAYFDIGFRCASNATP